VAEKTLNTAFMNANEISDLVTRELARIENREVTARIRDLLVTPYAVERSWDYGTPEKRFACWTVLERAHSNTAMVQKQHGRNA
jgi:hypothetical protein